MTEIAEEPINQTIHKSVSDSSSGNVNQNNGTNLGKFDDPVVDYLDYFGLSLDPFENRTSPLFQGGEREATLSQLLHLSQFSNSVSVVIGDPGVGKTCFRTSFLAYLEAQDLVCELEVPAINNLDQILSEIAYQFGLSTSLNDDKKLNGDNEQLFNSLHQFGAQTEEGDPLKLICIDDAHHLDDLTLERLIELAQPMEDEHRHIHLVVFGEPQLRERISAISKKKLAAKQSLLFQFLVVKPLSISELKEYLRFRLDNVGLDGLFPYKDEDIQFLWDISQGVPAALHDAAREILIELAMPPPENKSVGLPPIHLTLLAILVVGLLIAVFYQSRNDDDQLGVDPVSLPTKAEKLIDEQTIEESQLVVTPSGTKPNSFDASGDSNLEQVSKLQTIDQALQIDQTNEVNIDIPRATFDLETTPTPKVDSARLVVADNKTEASAKIKLNDSGRESLLGAVVTPTQVSDSLQTKPAQKLLEEKPLVRNTAKIEKVLLSVAEAALLSKPSESFALQILVASSLASAEDFIGRQANVKDLSVYPARRNKKIVFIVVAGNFSTLALARAAIKSLPNEQQKTGPWPRAFNGVHSDIREFRKL